jgi:SSS family solute:Na+ symporter
MLWKRATNKGGFWGLLVGTVTSVGLFLMVHFRPDALRYVAMSPDAKPMAETLFRALWAWIVCVLVTVVVSLCTQAKPDSELDGLVYGISPLPHEERGEWYHRPVVWASVVAVIFIGLNILFW